MASSRTTELNSGYNPSEGSPTSNYNTTNGNLFNTTTAPYRDDTMVKVELAVQSIAFIFAVIGNGAVICVLLPRWKKLARVHHFMLNLSIADMLVAFWTILEQLMEDLAYNGFLTVGGDPLCKFLRFMQLFPVYGSSYILVMCAIDRFIAICYPLKNYSWTNKRTYMLVTLAWGISFLLASPQFFLFSSQYDKVYDLVKCNHAWDNLPEWTVLAYTFYHIGFTFFIPLIVLVITYGCISYTVWVNVHYKMKTNNNKKENGVGSTTYGSGHISVIARDSTTGNGAKQAAVMPRTHSGRAFSRAMLKTVTLTFIVVCAFIVCWTPYSIMMVWWSLDVELPYRPGVAEVLTVSSLLTHLNSCCNPYIYVVFNYKIIKRFFCWRKKESRQFKDRVRLSSSSSLSSQATRVSIVSESGL
ncbi:cephalotocin receptor 2-like [Lineus longissimus]|uniref:cephalotocin receptor 2-like n=1 Tax=Lineus longissimus TaxID=88925 RepID=UPI00315DA257